ncbi:MAG TPA: hypothetical protein VNO75_12470 [Gemmatimonadaceae bacterium]|nr:hypothetical protein [Gemmatimonadaceae bacterium]
MDDRGDYRSIYCSLADDPDFRDMTPMTVKVFVVLRLTLGAAGIGVPRKLVVMEQVSCSAAELEAALVELETPKPDQQMGWIRRDRKAIWIVNALRFEPGLSPKSADHRKFVQKFLIPLGDSPVAQEFRLYYKEWVQGDEGESGPRTDPVEGVSAHKKQQTADKKLETRNTTAADATAAQALSRILITALNKGQLENPSIGSKLNPIPHGHGASLEAALSIVAAGVDEEFARSFVFAKAQAYQPNGRQRQINSLGYLSDGLIDEWEKARATSSARDASRPVAHTPNRGRKRAPPQQFGYSKTTDKPEDVIWAK